MYRCLEEGFLQQAQNRDQIKFALMRANHDWLETCLTQRHLPYPIRRRGEVCKEIFRKAIDHKICTINAWNERTEGGYLEPDTKHGYAYLKAIKKVFANSTLKAQNSI